MILKEKEFRYNHRFEDDLFERIVGFMSDRIPNYDLGGNHTTRVRKCQSEENSFSKTSFIQAKPLKSSPRFFECRY